MFGEFKTVDEKNEFEIVENGFVLRISGRSLDDDWITRSYVFKDQTVFFGAIESLSEIDKA
jgi:hypothetical protein